MTIKELGHPLPRKPEQDHSNLTALLALVVAAFIAGIFVMGMWQPPPITLDPVAIWCDGALDMNIVLVGEVDAEVADAFRVACYEDMASGTSIQNPAVSIEGFSSTVDGE